MSQAKNLERLWIGVFGQPPCIRAEPGVMAQILVESLPPAPPYRIGAAAGSEREAEEAIYLARTKA